MPVNGRYETNYFKNFVIYQKKLRSFYYKAEYYNLTKYVMENRPRICFKRCILYMMELLLWLLFPFI